MVYSLFTCLEFTISVSLNNQALNFVQLNGTNKLWRYNSLRGGHLKGKGKGVLGARETRFPPAPNPLSIPFQTPATQASDINKTRSGLTDQTLPPFQFDSRRDVDNNTLSHPGPGYEQKDHDQNPEKPASDIHCA